MPNSPGISPLRRLPSMSRVSRLARFPNSGGSRPLMLLLSRYRTSTQPLLSADTPNQVPIGSSLSQFTLFLHRSPLVASYRATRASRSPAQLSSITELDHGDQTGTPNRPALLPTVNQYVEPGLRFVMVWEVCPVLRTLLKVRESRHSSPASFAALKSSWEIQARM